MTTRWRRPSLLGDQVEKFAVATMEIPRRIGESAVTVTVYGIAPDSRYWTHADVSVDRVLVGEGLLKKWRGGARREV